MDCSLDSAYDGFNFKSLLKKGGDESEADATPSQGGGGGGGGVLSMIGGAIQGIGGVVGKNHTKPPG